MKLKGSFIFCSTVSHKLFRYLYYGVMKEKDTMSSLLPQVNFTESVIVICSHFILSYMF